MVVCVTDGTWLLVKSGDASYCNGIQKEMLNPPRPRYFDHRIQENFDFCHCFEFLWKSPCIFYVKKTSLQSKTSQNLSISLWFNLTVSNSNVVVIFVLISQGWQMRNCKNYDRIIIKLVTVQNTSLNQLKQERIISSLKLFCWEHESRMNVLLKGLAVRHNICTWVKWLISSHRK